MASGDIYQKNFETISELCRTYSRSKGKATKSVRENRSTKIPKHPHLVELLESNWGTFWIILKQTC